MSDDCFYVTATKLLREQADAVTRANCCMDCCILQKCGYEAGKKLVLECMKKREGMTRKENKDNLRQLVKVRWMTIFECMSLHPLIRCVLVFVGLYCRHEYGDWLRENVLVHW